MEHSSARLAKHQSLSNSSFSGQNFNSINSRTSTLYLAHDVFTHPVSRSGHFASGHRSNDRHNQWVTNLPGRSVKAHVILAGLPDQSSVVALSSTSYSYDDMSISSDTYSYPYTMTTATTAWQPPTFPTASAPSPCTEPVCPSLDGQSCVDDKGAVYGILCGTSLSGTVITMSGRLKEKNKRSCK